MEAGRVPAVDHGHDVGELLHGALLDPILWPPRLTQTGWPGTLGGGRRFWNAAVHISCLSPALSPL